MSEREDFRNEFIKRLWEIFRELSASHELPMKQCISWKRAGPGRSIGSYTEQEDMEVLLRTYPWHHFLSGLDVHLEKAYPRLRECVGTPSTGYLRMDSRGLVISLLYRLREEFGTWNLSNEQIVEQVEKLFQGLDLVSVRLRCRSPLLNFEIKNYSVPLKFAACGVTLRRFTDDEYNDIRADDRSWVVPRHSLYIPPDYLLEKTVDEPVTSNPEYLKYSEVDSEVRTCFDRILLALRTFKSGAVGRAGIRIEPIDAYPLVKKGCTRFGGEEYVPLGTYELSANELESFQEHVEHFLDSNPLSGLESACRRLSSASIRRDHNDKLLDAVIGMESILLAATGNEQYRGELRFRFSLHYALVFCNRESKKEEFEFARKLYDLRSRIAHGETIPRADINVAGGIGKRPGEIAKQAVETLRRMVKKCLQNGWCEEIKQPEFWQRALFQ